MPQSSITKACLLAGYSEKLRFFVLRSSPKAVDIFYRCFTSVEIIYLNKLKKPIIEIIRKKTKQEEFPCLAISDTLNLETVDLQLESLGSVRNLYIHVKHLPRTRGYKTNPRKETIISFLDAP